MADINETQAGVEDTAVLTEEERAELEARKAAEAAQFGQQGDRIDHTIGNMGGAGASASGPDIAEQSSPQVGNSSDLPSR
jgi:hypothetical protein